MEEGQYFTIETFLAVATIVPMLVYASSIYVHTQESIMRDIWAFRESALLDKVVLMLVDTPGASYYESSGDVPRELKPALAGTDIDYPLTLSTWHKDIGADEMQFAGLCVYDTARMAPLPAVLNAEKVSNEMLGRAAGHIYSHALGPADGIRITVRYDEGGRTRTHTGEAGKIGEEGTKHLVRTVPVLVVMPSGEGYWEATFWHGTLRVELWIASRTVGR